jgi:hypothetical protein
MSIDRLVQKSRETYNLCEPSAKVKDKKFSKTALYVKVDLRLGEKPCKVKARRNCHQSCELCVSKQKSRQGNVKKFS